MHRSHVRVAFSKLHRLVNFGAEIWATYSNRRGLSFVINALTTQVTQTEYLGQSALHTVTARFIFVLPNILDRFARGLSTLANQPYVTGDIRWSAWMDLGTRWRAAGRALVCVWQCANLHWQPLYKMQTYVPSRDNNAAWHSAPQANASGSRPGHKTAMSLRLGTEDSAPFAPAAHRSAPAV